MKCGIKLLTFQCSLPFWGRLTQVDHTTVCWMSTYLGVTARTKYSAYLLTEILIFRIQG